MPKDVEYATDQKDKLSRMKELLSEMQLAVMVETVPHEIKATILQDSILIWRLIKTMETGRH